MSKFLCIEYKQNLILQKRTALFGCRTGLKKLFEKNFFLLDVFVLLMVQDPLKQRTPQLA